MHSVPNNSAQYSQSGAPAGVAARRIALVNPTKFLGNLLLAGGLIQTLGRYCQQHDIALLVVLDESYKELFAGAFPGAALVYYPRRLLQRGVTMAGVRAWLRCVRQIRAFRAELAFTMEEDSVSHRLTHLSGADHKVSSTRHRYHLGFDEVLDINRSGRNAGEQSIWYSFREVFNALGLPAAEQPHYITLTPPVADGTLLTRLAALGLDLQRPVAVLHAGASKTYKKWPQANFAELAQALMKHGYQVALVGAGRADAEVNAAIMADLGEAGLACVDLCNALSLVELATVLTRVSLMVGNDSGPSHLASALGVRGVVIFGPTDVEIWHPLGAQTTVLENQRVCDPQCTRHQCLRRYECLRSVSPSQVLQALIGEFSN